MTTDRPTYTLTLRPLPGVDGVAALQAVLKRLLRSHGLRCIAVQVERHDAADGQQQAPGGEGEGVGGQDP